MREGDRDIIDQAEVANVLNQHFVSKVISLRLRIDKSTMSDPTHPLSNKKITSRFSLRTVDEKYVLKMIKNLKNKNSSGSDGITSRILKDTCSVIVVPLTRIINSSILSGRFPDAWKEAELPIDLQDLTVLS